MKNPSHNITAKPQNLNDNYNKELNYASLLHLSGLSIVTGIPFINIILPSYLWLMKKEESELIDVHGRMAINFQITITLIQLTFLLLGTLAIWLAPNVIQELLEATRTLKIVFATAYNLPFNLFTFIPFVLNILISLIGAIAAYHGEIAPSLFGFKFLSLNDFSHELAAQATATTPPPSTPPSTQPPQTPKRTSFG